MMKVIVVVAQEKFNNTEFSTVVSNLKKNDIPFEVASTSKSRASGYGSFSIVPDLCIQDLIVSDYDCLIIVGGSGCKRHLWNNTVLHEKIRTAHENNKLLAAICLAPICLIRSKIVDGSFITAYKTNETLRIIQESGNIYRESEVYISGNIITGNGPKASQKFCEAILSKIS
jgi:putative intracellular protease/amidase